MEIRVRTYDEVSAERVTIEVAPGQSATVEIVGPENRFYTAAEVGDLQASEAELVAAPLRRQVAEYDRDRRTERDRADRVTRERDSARRRVAELEEQLARSIGRENKLEADAAEEAILHRRSLEARDALLSAATTKVRMAREILTAPKVVQANRMDAGPRTVADAVNDALRVLEV